jgi:hypothetical protein
VLTALARMQPAVDEGGATLQPLPKVHRLLATPRCLPHVCQVRGWPLGPWAPGPLGPWAELVLCSWLALR